MRKIYFLCILLVSVFLLGAPVSRDQAVKVATNILQERIPEARDVDLRISEIDTKYHRRDTLYHVVRFEPSGMVIISGVDTVQPVLYYTFEGPFDPEDRPPAFEWWLENIKEQLKYVHQQNKRSTPGIDERWKRYSVDPESFYAETQILSAEPLITARWNQGWPYNTYCPSDPDGPGGRVVVGCVAVAMGQIMHYHKYPVMGEGEHTYTHEKYGQISAHFGDTLYNWDEMPAMLLSEDDDLAQLLFHCGVSVEMNYGPSGSGAWSGRVPDALINFFSYDSGLQYVHRHDYSDLDWNNLLRSEIDSYRPLYYRGAPEPGSGGHAFNIDGYQGVDHFHINWGWGGSYDGFYYINSLTPGSSDYTADQSAIISIKPQINFTAEPKIGFAPLEVQFTTSPDTDIVGWEWDFGDGDTSTEQEPVHTYIHEGKYSVSMTVTFANDTEYTLTKKEYITVFEDDYFAGGIGLPDDPFQVETADQLNHVRNHLNAFFIQNNDIDLGDYGDGKGWEPIGSFENPFRGGYEGSGHVIENLSINRQNERGVGLFGAIMGAEIADISLQNVQVVGWDDVGGLVGRSIDSDIRGCYSTGVLSGAAFIGGLVGLNDGNVIDSASGVHVSAKRNAGGLAGYNSGTIETSYAYGTVSGENDYVGGLAGQNNLGSITNSYAIGTVEGNRDIGGLAGLNYEGSIKMSYAAGKVSGSASTGGLVGRNYKGEIENSYYDEETSQQSDEGKGIPETTQEMMRKDTFLEWDFENIWMIYEEETYPHLELVITMEKYAASISSYEVLPEVRLNSSPVLKLTMRNRGTATWEPGQNVFLGAVGDSDALAFPEYWRVGLDHDVHFRETHTFQISLNPDELGFFTTEWQMMKDNQEELWFGQVFSKQIEVSLRSSVHESVWTLYK